jgi:hypothetical protein
VTPGVFFYYATIPVAAGTTSFCVEVRQSKKCSQLGLFALTQDQVFIWDQNCVKAPNQTATVSSDGSVARVCITGVTAGDYVISVKYDTKSIVGTPGDGNCEFDFVSVITQINGQNVSQPPVSGSAGKIIATLGTKNNPCTADNVVGGSCPAPITRATPTQEVTDLTVTAYPNPFTNKVNFKLVSPVSGNARLVVYNMAGQLVGVAYEGLIIANVEKTVEYKSPSKLNGMLFYRLSVGGKSVNGKVIKIE